jgi:hypothetical protein
MAGSAAPGVNLSRPAELVAETAMAPAHVALDAGAAARTTAAADRAADVAEDPLEEIATAFDDMFAGRVTRVLICPQS